MNFNGGSFHTIFMFPFNGLHSYSFHSMVLPYAFTIATSYYDWAFCKKKENKPLLAGLNLWGSISNGHCHCLNGDC